MSGHGIQSGAESRFVNLQIPDMGGDPHGFIQPLHSADERRGPLFHIGMRQAYDSGKLPVADAGIKAVETNGVGEKHGVARPWGIWNCPPSA